MRIRSFIFTALSLLLISCAKADQENADIFSVIKGRVTDADENPIEHMEVTIEISKRTAQKTVYTSSDGTFMIDITNREARHMESLTILTAKKTEVCSRPRPRRSFYMKRTLPNFLSF